MLAYPNTSRSPIEAWICAHLPQLQRARDDTDARITVAAFNLWSLRQRHDVTWDETAVRLRHVRVAARDDGEPRRCYREGGGAAEQAGAAHAAGLAGTADTDDPWRVSAGARAAMSRVAPPGSRRRRRAGRPATRGLAW